MKKFLYIILLLSHIQLLSQNNYQITATLKSKCQKVSVKRIVWDSLYYSGIKPEFTKKKNIYIAKGSITYPQAYRILGKDCNDKFGIYIINKGKNIFTFNNTKKEFSEINDELQQIFENYNSESERINNIIANDIKANNNVFPNEKKTYYDELFRKNRDKKNSFLYKYASNNINSYTVLWYLIYNIENASQYSEMFKKTFEILSQEVKSSMAGQRLSSKIEILERTEPGKRFPIEIVNQNFNFKKENKKYILVDFWFSHCGPCLNDFPKYKEVYSNYKDKGLEIIGVSTDRTQEINDWKKVIQEKDLMWRHLLDENGIESKKFNINAFPTTFLLDSDGIIIKKNISPEDLEEFLKQNL